MKKTNVNKILSIGAIFTALLTTAACSNTNSQDNVATKPESKITNTKENKTTSSSNSVKKTPAIKISQKEAIDTYKKTFKATELKEISLKKEHQQYVYEIEGFDHSKEYIVSIDAKTGKVLRSFSQKLELDERNQKPINLDNVISRKKASQIAEKHAKGTATEWTLEYDDGRLVWEVQVENGANDTDVKIDAVTKKVIEVD
ncbi:PepSY domain-containing protein [Lactobacillus kalixensis]|uniref:Peptidase propeptide and YPEB domain protein n=1 Tax=Lactobacillus kalixensis DSM 16043 TaxID=1423763 RepID=A0A0R1UGH7_9LACO|nr:PepSY domain-containing protein [Lactobacillus kalixensis]KRL90426.1 peptidase propeptide and YPEB domain protein [Lactobacillus kalixensis DSM 16043]